MKTIKFAIFINAPKEKVWNTMLEDATYREWTKPFNGNSHYRGDWNEGSKMFFVGTPDDSKEESGMVSRIAKNVPFTFISIQHIGLLENGVEKPWEGVGEAFENYTFTEKDSGTQVDVELTNIPDDYVAEMDKMWPKSLEALKALAEK